MAMPSFADLLLCAKHLLVEAKWPNAVVRYHVSEVVGIAAGALQTDWRMAARQPVMLEFGRLLV